MFLTVEKSEIVVEDRRPLKFGSRGKFETFRREPVVMARAK